MSESTKGIPARLRVAREQAGLSQGQVAKLLGVHRPTVSEMEAGRRRVQADELAQLAKIYRVSVSWLAEESGGDEDVDVARVQLAARELSKLKKDDFDRVLKLLVSLRPGAGKGSQR
jgi:transcriptional regulator with XRE-family HTH domain